MQDLIMLTGGVLSAVAIIVGGLIWLIYRVGKDHFISPRQVSEQIESMESRLRTDWHSSFGRMERASEKDRETMMEKLGQLDEDVRKALDVSYEAKSDAKDANHKAEMLKSMVDPLREVPDRLTKIETILKERYSRERE